MRLVEIRLLEGPNVYRLEPTVKLEVVVGRRRTWFGERLPGRHAIVRLGAAVPRAEAPAAVADLAAWVRRLHELAGAAAWLAAETEAGAQPEHGARNDQGARPEQGARNEQGARPGKGQRRRRLPVTIHRTSEPGHWIVAFPWRERERAEAIAEGALRLAERGASPARARRSSRTGSGRVLGRVVDRIREAGTTPPPWIRDADRTIPAVSISGTNGKSTTTRMVTRILRLAGRRVGTTTSDGVLVDETLVEAGDLTGPMGAHAVLRRPDVEVAVLETARGGIVLKGVGYESNEVAVLTNVSPDHLDLHGLHTLPELAEVKSVIARMTRPDGVVVLNADDPLVAAVGRTVRAQVCLFSLRPGNTRVRRHLARGGCAVLVEDGWVVEARGAERHRIVRVAHIPAALGGLARHNLANALAAAGASRGLGASLEAVARGLRDFRPTSESAPGRLNLYRVGERLVVVDFAHNEAGLNVVLDVVEGLTGPKGRRKATITAIVGTAGDRPDDSLRGIGRIAAERADEVAVKETLRYLRGRTRESMIGELMAGLALGGVRAGTVPVYEDEPTAVRGELTDPTRAAGSGQPAALLLMCHADREGVETVLRELGAVPLGTGESVDDLAAALGGRRDGREASPPGRRTPPARRSRATTGAPG